MPFCFHVQISSPSTTANVKLVKEGNILDRHLVWDVPGLPQRIQVQPIIAKIVVDNLVYKLILGGQTIILGGPKERN